MYVGECPKIHELALRADYQQARNNKDYFYDVEATEHLNAFIQDCDRRTELAKKRLAETQEELSAEVSSKAERVHELSETIGKKLAQAEQAGAGQAEAWRWKPGGGGGAAGPCRPGGAGLRGSGLRGTHRCLARCAIQAVSQPVF